MSELIENINNKKELLKHIILQIHKGEAPDQVRTRLKELLGSVPYDIVVEVEQELIQEGLPEEEVIKLCDIHSEVLEGSIDQSGARSIPPGHPADVFKKENVALTKLTEELLQQYNLVNKNKTEKDREKLRLELLSGFNQLMDIDKHYQRKENLVFPFLEKHDITAPPKVMWAKHDETRDLLKAALETLNNKEIIQDDPENLVGMILRPASKAVLEMIMKEEEILFPMCMDVLSEQEWYEIHLQTPDIGFCLVEPDQEWAPENIDKKPVIEGIHSDRIQLPTGSLQPDELLGILNVLPVDVTFVDKNDKVKFFSGGEERIFTRSKAVLQRNVRLCHPPSSVGVVEQILNDFKSGKQDRAPFWIQMKDKFIHIEYFAIRDGKGEYLGTLEVTQDLTGKRELSGEQRLLSYSADQ